MRERKAAGYLDRLAGRPGAGAVAEPPRRLHWPARITHEPGPGFTVAGSGNGAVARPVAPRAAASQRPADGQRTAGGATPGAELGDRRLRRMDQRGPAAALEPGHPRRPARPGPEQEGPPAGPGPEHEGRPAGPAAPPPGTAAARATGAGSWPADTRPADVLAELRPRPVPVHLIGGARARTDDPASGEAPDLARTDARPRRPAARLAPVRPADRLIAAPAVARDEPEGQPETAPGQGARIEIGLLEVRVSAPLAAPRPPSAASGHSSAGTTAARLSRAAYPFGLRQG